MNARQQAEQPRPALVNLEAEQALLGAALRANEIFDIVQGILDATHFAEAVHARIYEVSQALIKQGTPVSPITLKNWFDADGTLQAIGGIEYLISLGRAVITIANAPTYARIIRDLAVRRELAKRAELLIEEAHSLPVDGSVNSLAAEAADDLVKLAAQTGMERIRSLYDVADSALTAIQKRMNGDRDESLIRTGLSVLDEHLGGLARGELVIIGGRPGMGKSALADMLAYLAATAGYVTLLWTGEMAAEAVSERMMTAAVYEPESVVHYSRASTGRLTKREFERMCTVHNTEFQKLPLVIDDRPKISPAQLRAAAAKVRLKYGRLDLVIADYLGLMASNNRQLTRLIEITTDISSSLKELARDLSTPVIALHQLNREVERRDNKRPQLSDLRESGAIEQDADMVWFAYREEYYLNEEKKSATGADIITIDDRLRLVKSEMEIIIAKLRRGPTGSVKVFCDIGANYIGSFPEQEGLGL